MKLILLQKPLEVVVTRFIQEALTQKQNLVLGLPTGATVEPVYAFWREQIQQGILDFSQVTTFNMDEYVGLSNQDPHSYYAYMSTHLFQYIAHGPRYQLNGTAVDLQQECLHYEKQIQQAGGIDIFIGGVGRNGHIAFNEPNTPFDSKTHLVPLTPSTRQANARFFGGDINRVPTHALTVGIGTILAAKQLLFLATGFSKAQAVAQLEKQGSSLSVPLTALKLHKNAILAIDEAAASALQGPLLQKLQSAKKQNPQADFWVAEVFG